MNNSEDHEDIDEELIEYDHQLDSLIETYDLRMEADYLTQLNSYARFSHYTNINELASDMLHVYVSKMSRKYAAQLRYPKKIKKLRLKIRKDHYRLLKAYATSKRVKVDFVIYRILKHMIERTKSNGVVESPNTIKSLKIRGLA